MSYNVSLVALQVFVSHGVTRSNRDIGDGMRNCSLIFFKYFLCAHDFLQHCLVLFKNCYAR